MTGGRVVLRFANACQARSKLAPSRAGLKLVHFGGVHLCTRPAGGAQPRDPALRRRRATRRDSRHAPDPPRVARADRSAPRGRRSRCLLAGRAGAAAAAAIVKQQRVESGGRQHGGVQDAVADVSGIAVAKQQRSEHIRPGADPPTVERSPSSHSSTRSRYSSPARLGVSMTERKGGRAAVEQRPDHRRPGSSAGAPRAAPAAAVPASARGIAASTTHTAVSRSVRRPGWTTRGPRADARAEQARDLRPRRAAAAVSPPRSGPGSAPTASSGRSVTPTLAQSSTA